MIDGIDKFIGAKIKMYRSMRGLNQRELSDELNLNFQQIQKYEKGESKIRASKLLKAAKILNIPIECFFEGYEKIPVDGINDTSILGLELQDNYEPYGEGNSSEKELISLMFNFNRISDKRKRDMAIMFVASLVEDDEEGINSRNKGELNDADPQKSSSYNSKSNKKN